MQDHLNKFSENFDQVLAFKPTGWTYSDSCLSLLDIKPQTRGRITIYGISVVTIQCIWLCEWFSYFLFWKLQLFFVTNAFSDKLLRNWTDGSLQEKSNRGHCKCRFLCTFCSCPPLANKGFYMVLQKLQGWNLGPSDAGGSSVPEPRFHPIPYLTPTEGRLGIFSLSFLISRWSWIS